MASCHVATMTITFCITFLCYIHVQSAVLLGAAQSQIGIGEPVPYVLHRPEEAVQKHSCDPWATSKCAVNFRPIIGILAQEVPDEAPVAKMLPKNTSHIAASYVKWVESAGARVVPILISQPDSYYTDLFRSINGVLFPGGAASLTDSGYSRAGRLLFSLAMKANSEGTYFPIFGTCLGFEFLSVIYTNASILSWCTSENVSLALDFQPGYQSSRLFGNASADMIEILNKDNITANSHHFCVSVEDYEAYNMSNSFRMLATTTNAVGQVFVSVAEVEKYPIYGVQFHPEKSNFEWQRKSAFSHSANAVRVSQYFANFFVAEARKNHHHFSNLTHEYKSLIYNWTPTYMTNSPFNQVYFFPS